MRNLAVHKAMETRCRFGFTLMEVVIAICITSIVLLSVVNGYILAARRAEWISLSAAAQNVVSQRAEQIRAGRWEPTADLVVDDLVGQNFPPQEVVLRPLPGNEPPVVGTNTTIIRTISTTPPLKFIKISCTWRFVSGRVFTNDLVMYRGPDL